MTRQKNILKLIFNYLLCFILLFSAVAKIVDTDMTIKTVKAFFSFPHYINVAAAISLTITELVLGIFLLFNIKKFQASILTSLLFFFFLMFSIYGVVIGIKDDCGCFGSLIESSFNGLMIVRNAALFLISMVLVIYQYGERNEQKVS